MNKYFKYIIFFLLSFIIYFVLRKNLKEGFNDDAFVLLSRIIGETEEGDNRTDYTGCQNYTCDNKTYTYDYLNSISETELITLAFEYVDKDYSLNNFYEIFNEEYDTDLTKENYALKLRVNTKSSNNKIREFTNITLHRRESSLAGRTNFFGSLKENGLLPDDLLGFNDQLANSIYFYSDGDTLSESSLVIIQNQSGFNTTLFYPSAEIYLSMYNRDFFSYQNKNVFYSGVACYPGIGGRSCDINHIDNNYHIHIELLFESTIVGLGNHKNQIIRNIIKKTKSKKYVSKDYDPNNIDYLTCNNEPGNLPSSSLGKKCNHEICCFDTNCNSPDAKSIITSNLTVSERRSILLEYLQHGMTRNDIPQSMTLLDGQCEENTCNSGTCVNYNENQYYCNCPNGTHGSRCDEEWNLCSEDNCSDRCVQDNPFESHCECFDFFTPMINGELDPSNSPGSYCGLPSEHICSSGTKIKKDSNCRSIEGCKNNFAEFCCSNTISDDVQLIFDTLDGDNDGFINLEELRTYVDSTSDAIVTSQLNKFLTKTRDEDEQNVKLDKYDLNDLLNE